MIHSIYDLARELGGEPDNREHCEAQISKRVYKGTDCGAWFKETQTGIEIGSIVEGFDGDGVGPVSIPYPFELKVFWTELDRIDKAASAIWTWANAEYADDGEEEAASETISSILYGFSLGESEFTSRPEA